MPQQLRELLLVIPASPETDELQDYLTLYCESQRDLRDKLETAAAELLHRNVILMKEIDIIEENNDSLWEDSMGDDL